MDFLKSIPCLGPDDVEADAAWRFALIGVLSHRERDALNVAQLHNYAQFHGLPVVRWRRQLDLATALGDAPVDEIYDNEPNLWDYFVEGAPGLMAENMNPPRHLVNGTPCLFDHLRFAGGEVPAALEAAYGRGTYGVVTLDEAPEAIVVRVGSTSDDPYYWHEIALPDLREELVAAADAADQLVVLTLAAKTDDVEITSAVAATHGVLSKLKTRTFPVMLAFALTDYKVQGRTLPKLVINMPARHKAPFMDLEAFYVLQSRVQLKKNLRFLRKDETALVNLAKKRYNAFLCAWDNGYDDHGLWNDARATDAYEKAVALEEERKVAERRRAKEANYAQAKRAGHVLASHHARRRREAAAVATAAAEGRPPQGAAPRGRRKPASATATTTAAPAIQRPPEAATAAGKPATRRRRLKDKPSATATPRTS